MGESEAAGTELEGTSRARSVGPHGRGRSCLIVVVVVWFCARPGVLKIMPCTLGVCPPQHAPPME